MSLFQATNSELLNYLTLVPLLPFLVGLPHIYIYKNHTGFLMILNTIIYFQINIKPEVKPEDVPRLETLRQKIHLVLKIVYEFSLCQENCKVIAKTPVFLRLVYLYK